MRKMRGARFRRSTRHFLPLDASMRLSARLSSLCQQGMVDSLSVDMMVTLVRKVIPNYDLHYRSGIPDSIPIHKKDASNQILSDIRNEGFMLDFVNTLVKTHVDGYMGRPHRITSIQQIVREMLDLGYQYDDEFRMFIENSEVQRTPNWGVLKDGEEYPFTFLRLDIAGNSVLVRENPAEEIDKAYGTLRSIVETAVAKQNGRIWAWEGDGVLAAFYFSKKNTGATLAAIEIINELFLFNTMRLNLKTPLNVRIAVHAGHCVYSRDMDKVKKSDTVKRVIEIESKHTALNSVTISGTTGQHFSDLLVSNFEKTMSHGSVQFYTYGLCWEKP